MVVREVIMTKINISDDFIISGINTYILPFTIEHARSEQYLKWLRDYDVIKSLNARCNISSFFETLPFKFKFANFYL